MTTAAISPMYADLEDTVPDGAPVVQIVRLDHHGWVTVQPAALVRRAKAGYPARYLFSITQRRTLGLVDPTDPDAYRHADRILAAQGWKRRGQWTTVLRWPACQVVRSDAC